MSYGFTNFAWIWLWLNKDRRLFEWSLLILSWWFCCPLLAGTFAPSESHCDSAHNRRLSWLDGTDPVYRLPSFNHLQPLAERAQKAG